LLTAGAKNRIHRIFLQIVIRTDRATH
jgi:hypothetical protein